MRPLPRARAENQSDDPLSTIAKKKNKKPHAHDDKPVVEVAGDKLPVEVDVTVKGVRVRVLVTLQKRNDPPETRDAERL